MYKVLHFLLGYIRIKISGKDALLHINTLHNEKYGFWNMEASDDCYLISCSVKDADRLLARLEKAEAQYEVQKRVGLPFAVYPYRRRLGLIVGFVLAMVIIYASSSVLWEIRIDCNGDLDEKQVLAELKKLGVHEGASIKDIKIYETELGFLIRNPRFSDIAVNVQGTVAEVKLRVRNESPRQEDKTGGAFDVIASEAGIISSVSAVKGKPVVKKGDTVDKGDVLISGIMEGAYGEYYVHHAYGSVKATVFREFSVTVPLETEEKAYTGRTERKTSYVILGKSFDLFGSEFSKFDMADIVVAEEKLQVMGVKLPIVKQTLIYKEYMVTPVLLTEKEACERAENAFHGYIERETVGEVINTETECVYNEELGAIVLNGTVELITEIGKESPMTVLPETE